MQMSRLLRLLLAIIVGLLALLLLIVLLYVTEAALVVWDHLKTAPIWFLISYSFLLLILAAGIGWLLWRILVPRRASTTAKPTPQALPTEAEITQRVIAAEQAGMDVDLVRQELTKLRERRAAGSVYISLFGEISSGKSSLIKALLPEAQVVIGARGGTTRTVDEYRWHSASFDELVLVDVPGTNEVGVILDGIARAEAQRSHVVMYVCDGDLSRSQWLELQALLELSKPCIVVLNKTDRYTEVELNLLLGNLRQRLEPFPLAELVAVQSGGVREALRILPDGTEELVMREIPPKVDNLVQTVQQCLDENIQVLEQLRDSAVFSLVANRLDAAEAAFRNQKAAELVTEYSHKAMLGAMAAVAPGTDLVIQGYLGISLVKALSDLYQVPVHKADRSRLLELVQKQVGQSTTLILAVAGNALKAFPGIGTIAGGLLHAVAYGLIFKSLGKAVAQSFATRGALHPLQTAKSFKETLGEEIEVSGREMARMALRLAHEQTGHKYDSE